MSARHRLVIVGGGAGGLGLATRLGNSLGKKGIIDITLVDNNLTHIWKPIWHEVAAGTLTSSEDELNYIPHAYQHFFKFQLGSLTGLDRENKKITLSPVYDHGKEVLPARELTYDTLVIAIGSVSHDFNVPGVKEFCFFLDKHAECERFHQSFLKHLMQLRDGIEPELNIAIVGGGATGVELAAELQFACDQFLQYHHKKTQVSRRVHITIIENSPRLLSALPEKISTATLHELERRGIKALLGEQVVKVDVDHVYTKSGKVINATLKLWAAGIKAPEVLTHLGLATNKRNQLLVTDTLQTTFDKSIFAFGDCASCPQDGVYDLIPPRAQVAQQQADLLVKSLPRYFKHESLLSFNFNDYGSLITLSHHYTLGNLMGKTLGSVMLEGKLARLTYLFLYRRHQANLYGWWRVGLLALSQWLSRAVRPQLKLH